MSVSYGVFGIISKCLPCAEIQVKSLGKATIVKGRVVHSDPVISTVTAVVQPLPHEKAEHIEDASRRAGAIEILSDQAFDITDPTNDEARDELVWEGREYVFCSVENWKTGFGAYRYTAILKGEG